MSRLPAPDSGWRESTEGDLDADLAEEAGSSLDDWREPPRTRWATAPRVMSLILLVTILGAAIAEVVLLSR